MTDKIEVWIPEGEDGDDILVELKTKFEVCGRCQGRGTHVNEAIDGNGLPQEYAEDMDFMEDYLAGVYDVICTECHGNRVVAVVDPERNDPKLMEAYEKMMQEEYEYRQMVEAERRMGC